MNLITKDDVERFTFAEYRNLSNQECPNCHGMTCDPVDAE